MAAVLSAPPDRRIGRFQLVRALGRGAQGEVWLAEDTRLGRSVALKTLLLDAQEDESAGALLRTLLDEARIVSSLQHPNLVALFDVGEERGAPYLVFEYVEGQTLSRILREQRRLPPARAVEIAIALARGMGYAHGQNVVHRDLKPANIMMTPDGVPRIMDFGIAHRGVLREDDDAPLIGTPSYMAPEYITDGVCSPASDLFALGVILYEMLTGQAPVRSPDIHETLRRIVEEPFHRAVELNPELDERLDAIVMRAVAKNPAARFASAAQLAAALGRYLDPETAQPADEGGAHGTLEFLLRRIRHKSDFPALSGTIGTINKLLVSERESTSVLCNTILKDFALTNLLLRRVNSAYYSQFDGSISTVSRAIAILGFDGVRNLAVSLMLFEHLHKKANAVALKDEVISAYFSGMLTRELAHRAGVRDAEQAFICAMFHRLGKLLVIFYLHDEAEAIAGMVKARGWDEERAAKEVLGIGYDELGIGVGQAWNFPASILASMKPLQGAPKDRPALPGDRLRLVADLANRLCDVVRNVPGAERSGQLAALADRYGAAAGVNVAALSAAVAASVPDLSKDAETLGFSVSRSALFANAASWAVADASDAAPGDAAAADDDTTLLGDTRLASRETTKPPAPAGVAAQATNRHCALSAGIEDITQALAGDYKLNDVLRIVLETMYRGIGFGRVLLMVRDPARNALRCRFGFGADVDAIVQRHFSIPLAGARDVFFAAVGQGVDICIEDIDTEKMKPYVPEWYRKAIPARGFVLLPIMVKGRAVGLIYGDSDSPGVLRFQPEELSLLKTLRNQAVLAVQQKG
jgi:serine/threonine protein kinase